MQYNYQRATCYLLTLFHVGRFVLAEYSLITVVDHSTFSAVVAAVVATLRTVAVVVLLTDVVAPGKKKH